MRIVNDTCFRKAALSARGRSPRSCALRIFFKLGFPSTCSYQMLSSKHKLTSHRPSSVSSRSSFNLNNIPCHGEQSLKAWPQLPVPVPLGSNCVPTGGSSADEVCWQIQKITAAMKMGSCIPFERRSNENGDVPWTCAALVSLTWRHSR